MYICLIYIQFIYIYIHIYIYIYILCVYILFKTLLYPVPSSDCKKIIFINNGYFLYIYIYIYIYI